MIKGRITSVRIYKRKTTYEIQDINREGYVESTYKWSHPTSITESKLALLHFAPGDLVTFKKKGSYEITEPEFLEIENDTSA